MLLMMPPVMIGGLQWTCHVVELERSSEEGEGMMKFVFYCYDNCSFIYHTPEDVVGVDTKPDKLSW